MGRLVINDSMSVNGSFEAPSPGWLVLDDDISGVVRLAYRPAGA